MLANLPGYPNAEANAINDAGTVLGRAFNGPDGQHAVRWDANGAISEFGHLGVGEFGTTEVSPRAINSEGAATGTVLKYDDEGHVMSSVSVLWKASETVATELVPLDTSPTFRGALTYASAINDSGTIVGSASKPPAQPGEAFGSPTVRWDTDGTSITERGHVETAPDGFNFAIAWAINTNGLIVGDAANYDENSAQFEGRAVYWNSTGAAVDLNSLVDPASGWVLTSAAAVSNTNWIAGIGVFDPDGPGGQDAYDRWFLLQLPAGLPGDYNAERHRQRRRLRRVAEQQRQWHVVAESQSCANWHHRRR